LLGTILVPVLPFLCRSMADLAKEPHGAAESDGEEEIVFNKAKDTDEEDDSDDEDELILLARVSRLDTSAKAGSSKQQRKLQTKLEKQREQEREQKEQERKQQARVREAEQKQTKTEKRLLFTLESLRVADSHVYSPSDDTSRTGAQAEVPPETSAGLKKLYSEAYQLAQSGKGKEAIPKLEATLDAATEQNNRVVGFSAAALLGEESLKLGNTRRGIDCLESALENAKTLPHVTLEQKKYLVARLQGAYADVGDVERANEAPETYGLGRAAPSRGTEAKELSPAAASSLNAAIETAIGSKDLEPLRSLVFTLRMTPVALALAKHKHPSTGATALHAASGRNDPELVHLLVVMGANMDEKDALGQAPLVWAARYGGGDALEALVSLGARFDPGLSSAEIEKWSAAIKQRVKQLISKGS
jgi:hypothetical protein